MTELKLYNTLTRKKEPFTPLDASNVRMYVCGPTVYDFAHIGNARPVIVFDVLFRLLRHLYGEAHVTYARNITDVDDKINDRAARDYPDLPLNEAIRKVTEGTNAQYQANVKALGCLEPTHQPRATDHLDGMIQVIQQLLAKGHAYIASGAEGREVLFSVASMPRYGRLSNRKLNEQIEGARVAVEPHKKSPGDFVLWKESSGNQPGWPAEFTTDAGAVTILGRPGWHIECSAMSMATLLEPFGGGLSCDDPVKNTFDIHGGGLDLIFPHHENEIAQSCCAFGKPGQPNPLMAQVWMHNGFLQVEGQKMSKSLGNFVTINELLATDKFGGRRWPGEVLRLAMLKTHYRQPIDWTVAALEESANILEGWAYTLKDFATPTDVGANAPREVIDALADDLNISSALAAMHGFAKGARAGDQHDALRLFDAIDLLGIDRSKWNLKADEMLFKTATDDGFNAKIDTLINLRRAAREAKNFAESDRIRDELVAMGIQIMDSKDPITGKLETTWEVKR